MAKITDDLTIDFEHLYEEPCPNCEAGLDWEWDADNIRFSATCECFNEYTLTPHHGIVEDSDA